MDDNPVGGTLGAEGDFLKPRSPTTDVRTAAEQRHQETEFAFDGKGNHSLH